MSCNWFHPSLRPQLLCFQLHLSSLLHSFTLLIFISSSYSASSHNSRGLVQQENDPNTRYLCKGPLGEYAACQCDEEEHEVACINAQFVDTGVFQYINSHYSSVARVTFHGNNFQDLPDEPLFGETTYTNLNVLNISANYIVNLHSNALKAVPNIKILDLSNNEIVLAEDNINFLMHTPKLTHMLDLSYNYFSSVPYNLPCPFPSISRLDLRQNVFKTLTLNTTCLEGIDLIDLSRNHFHQLDEKFRREFANLLPAQSLLLRNSFHCDCKSHAYVQWIRSTNTIREKKLLTCSRASPPNFLGTRLVEVPLHQLNCDIDLESNGGSTGPPQWFSTTATFATLVLSLRHQLSALPLLHYYF